VDQDSDGNTVLACPYVKPGCLYPEEVSACIVQQLLEDAAQHTGVPSITKAVITVPAYFDDEQRDATIAAGVWARSSSSSSRLGALQQLGGNHSAVQCLGAARRLYHPSLQTPAEPGSSCLCIWNSQPPSPGACSRYAFGSAVAVESTSVCVRHHPALTLPPLFAVDPCLPATACCCQGKLAGLETVKLIREPVAAALAYGLDLSEEQVRQQAGCRAVCSQLEAPTAGSCCMHPCLHC
jgi:hypothetical protein